MAQTIESRGGEGADGSESVSTAGGAGGTFGTVGGSAGNAGGVVPGGGGGGGAGAAGGSGGTYTGTSSGSGSGGQGGSAGANGGSRTTIDGTDGDPSTGNYSGGGGGGGGGSAAYVGIAGEYDLSGNTVGGQGGNGGEAVNGGAAGGGGSGGYGAAAVVDDVTISNTGNLVGGGGGQGGTSDQGPASQDSGAAGGDGGGGAYFGASGGELINSGNVSGDTGGAGGNGSTGGDGGAGAVFINSGKVINTGNIVGGRGGAAGSGGSAEAGSGGSGVVMNAGGSIDNSSNIVGGSGQASAGGAGVVGAGVAILNTGIIAGGGASPGADGAQADAIDFTGGANSLTLSAVNRSGTYEQGMLVGDVAVGGSATVDPGTAAGVPVWLDNTITDYTDPTTGDTTAGSLTKAGAGTLVLSGQNTYSGSTTLDAGTLELASATDATGQHGPGQDPISYGAAGTGGIAFGTTGPATLQVDSAALTSPGGPASYLAYALTGFASGDAVDLTNLGASGATARYSGTDLTVTSGTASDTLDINAAPAGYEYRVQSDDRGGTDVVLAKIPAPNITAPANGSDTNNNKPTIAGTGESGDTVDLTIARQGGGTTTASASVVNGAWSYSPTGALTDGEYSVTAVEASPSGAGTSATSTARTFTVDTTAPFASSPSLTVAQNSGPTRVGIAAPSDNLSTAGSLAITAGSLPGDGTVTLADGTTPVTASEHLTSAQLTGLEFTPAPGVAGRSSTFTYTVADGAGNATTGTAALAVGAAGAPKIAGTYATTDQAEAPASPFAGVTVSDPSDAAGATETLAIQLTGAGGTLADGTGYTGARTLSGGGTSYQITGTAAAVTAELDDLSFAPTAGAPAATGTTAFALADRSSTGASVADSGTSVADTASPPPPVQPAPDAVSISQQVTYGTGVFTLSGTASSAAGVSSVEISALVDGVATDLGAATVNADGSFVFSDFVGAHTQSFLTATETDGAGGMATGDAPYSLTGGLGAQGFAGRQDSYSADGSTSLSSTLFRPNGARQITMEAPGQTVDLQPYDSVLNHGQAGTTFVYAPGEAHTVDVLRGFKTSGANHDTIALPSADFKNFAAVLRDTSVVNGNAAILDRQTNDAVVLVGVSPAELKSHPNDFTFHT